MESASDPPGDLCSVCSQINFNDIALPEKHCNDACKNATLPSAEYSGDSDSDFSSDLNYDLDDLDSDSDQESDDSASESTELSSLDTKLGTNHDISLRADTCALCRLIDKSLQRLYPTCVGDITLRGGRSLVVSSLPSDTEPQHTHTTVATIEYAFNDEEGPRNYIPGSREVGRVLDLQLLRDASQTSSVEEQMSRSRIGGRTIPATVNFELLKTWFNICKTSHGDICSRGSESPNDMPKTMPAFVIDVKQACIIATPTDCTYVALSYVWGKAAVLKHLLFNSNSLQTPGSLNSNDIPRTVRDAISATVGLDERYLWVDALCIVQDDPAMKLSQIEKMDQIYAGAALTLVAGEGDSAAAGLPGIHTRSSEVHQEVLCVRDHTFLTVVGAYRSREVNYGEFEGPSIQDSTWMHRAWTMQELCFSNRSLIFTGNQAFWRCHKSIWSEEVALEEAKTSDLEIMPMTLERRFPMHAIETHHYFKLYCNYLRAYRQRSLTFKSDLLNAFQGMVSVFSRTQKDEYFWGHPESLFSASLGWLFECKHIRNFASQQTSASDGETKDLEFPSWCWAAWDNQEEDDRELDFWSCRAIDAGLHNALPPHPAITQFYIAIERDKVVAINEFHTKKLEWQGSAGGIPQDTYDPAQESNLLPGTLLFWASVATLRVRLTGGSPSDKDSSTEFDDTNSGDEYEEYSHTEKGKWKITGRSLKKEDTHQVWLSRQEDGRLQSLYEIILPDENTKLSGTFPVSFAAIYKDEGSRFDSAFDGKRHPKLMLLALEWRQGMAYRMGLGEIDEEKWASLSSREWKLIKMR
ncbi:heterokaryon incompatibility protein [Fusarium pseudocircinatum]|uniref:Heterokaryon incompatibility protein n=1 Tax=Fusarium pseudocircinatum TaxID=56676 RepID=A0A8H5PTC4_9HYPO|nr:heterokaryon incompatibility protein [Fusarium pseudocircinatum]